MRRTKNENNRTICKGKQTCGRFDSGRVRSVDIEVRRYMAEKVKIYKGFAFYINKNALGGLLSSFFLFNHYHNINKQIASPHERREEGNG